MTLIVGGSLLINTHRRCIYKRIVSQAWLPREKVLSGLNRLLASFFLTGKVRFNSENAYKIRKEYESNYSAEELNLASVARRESLGWISKLPEKWIPFAELARIDKPVGALLLLLPSCWAIFMGAYSVATPLGTTLGAFSLFGVGAFVMRSFGCTINDILDRKLDRKVIRTIERPIASGRVSVPQAVGSLTLQGLVGLLILLLLPFECVQVGLYSVPLILIYPLFKRVTYYPQAMLSTVFSWGCILGFPAVYAPMYPSIVLPLYASNFLWCMTYDTIYAHQDKEFDINAGVKSTALAWGEKTKPILYGLSSLQLLCYNFAGYMNSMGPGFYFFSILGFYNLFKLIKKVDLNNSQSCWKAFVGNIRTGAILLFGIVLDYVLLLLGII